MNQPTQTSSRIAEELVVALVENPEYEPTFGINLRDDGIMGWRFAILDPLKHDFVKELDVSLVEILEFVDPLERQKIKDTTRKKCGEIRIMLGQSRHKNAKDREIMERSLEHLRIERDTAIAAGF